MNKKYSGGRKEKFKFKRSNKFIDYNSSYNSERFINEPDEYLIKEEYDFSLKSHVIKRVLIHNLVFFAVLFLLSFLLYCIKHLIEGN